ncbi:uncharacterized protein LOC126455617 [Schistocerca serialis cubense]|uniref:uncharacterized protein LOC126455617 n=1 Tax=Schistocerca serialis cubense TaxID=2023355 RepID=UPI00214F13E0|nr:uncharacterized protein LOC126455617 [Schistocerca serialis cubense]
MTETDDRLPPPEWLDEKLVAQALRRAEQDEELEVEALDVGYACDRGVNFLSEMLRVTASVKRGAGEARTQRRSLLAKCLLRAGPLRTVVQEAGIFRRETLVYTVMLPAAEAALQAAEGDRWKPLAARCHHSGSRPTDFLLLEDLAEAGFAMSPRGRLLDRQHCSLVLETVARLHAASVLLADHEALAAESFSQHPMFTKYGRDHFSVVTDRLYSALADVLGTIAGCVKYALMYRDTKSTVFDKLQGVFDSCRPQLKVLAHGDLWKNNIMFRYVDDRPVDVRLVDFQNCFWSSPAADLQHFLGSSASLEVHQQHVEGLVSEYHAVLQRTLRALGLHRQADAYPLHQLRLDMDHFAAHALCMASVMPPVILAPESLGKDAEEALNNSQRNDTFFRQIVSNPEFISRIKYVLPAYEKVGAM